MRSAREATSSGAGAATYLEIDCPHMVNKGMWFERGFDAWHWVPLSDVVDLVAPFKRPVYQQVAEAFATHARPAPSDR